jgi:hypothetical protein
LAGAEAKKRIVPLLSVVAKRWLFLPPSTQRKTFIFSAYSACPVFYSEVCCAVNFFPNYEAGYCQFLGI